MQTFPTFPPWPNSKKKAGPAPAAALALVAPPPAVLGPPPPHRFCCRSRSPVLQKQFPQELSFSAVESESHTRPRWGVVGRGKEQG